MCLKKNSCCPALLATGWVKIKPGDTFAGSHSMPYIWLASGH